MLHHRRSPRRTTRPGHRGPRRRDRRRALTLAGVAALAFALAVSLAVGAGCDDGGGDPSADVADGSAVTGMDAHCRNAPLEGCPCEDRPVGFPRRCCAAEYDGTQLVCERSPRPQDAVWERRDDICLCMLYAEDECNPITSRYRRCVPYAEWLDG